MIEIIVFQGDSVTDCGRSYEAKEANQGLGGGYPLLAAGRLLRELPAKNLRCYNRGISGNRVVDLYARWKIDTLNLKPDFISILIGVNDIWHEFANHNGVETERFERVYRELLSWTLEVLPSVRLLLIEPFALECGAVSAAWRPELAGKQQVVRKLAAEFKTLFLPAQELLNAAVKEAPSSGPEYWLADGVHPTIAGHTVLADAWCELVKPLCEV
ncbi:SGNH/GDSL hydrolase family protein [Victivallis sp. Marseille-Q1083]|uniref:SGNH/GDSL hydrolase family protein n=1 Tax=Victivallis sp. Marseille-Q1083 TaxID=2717288 RepID=UPI00158D279F|nr:SGNH/GDSL hydrolase family protein [Victivallis sp. Marseille-Q1083]